MTVEMHGKFISTLLIVVQNINYMRQKKPEVRGEASQQGARAATKMPLQSLLKHRLCSYNSLINHAGKITAPNHET